MKTAVVGTTLCRTRTLELFIRKWKSIKMWILWLYLESFLIISFSLLVVISFYFSYSGPGGQPKIKWSLLYTPSFTTEIPALA